MRTIEAVLGADGLVASVLPGYEHRPAQLAMAKHVHRGFLEQMHVIVEAGTGTGKTFGYLVPALLSGQRVVVSTATIALQEQLLAKDIPLLRKAVGREMLVVQLKGRTNYLCRDKFEQLRKQLTMAQSAEERSLFAWADATRTGDRGELDFVPSPRLWAEVDTDADDCLMEACDFFGPTLCHHMRAREAARFADIVVVNHALFFADLAMGGGLIPSYDFAVLDEAHQIEEWATAAFSSTISRQAIGRLLRKIHRQYVFDEALADELAASAAAFSDALAVGGQNRYRLDRNPRAIELMEPLQRALYRTENWIADRWKRGARFAQVEDTVLERKRDLLVRAVVAHTQTIERLRLSGDEWIAWAERSADARDTYAATCAPITVAPLLRELLFEKARCVVMTSATIATDGDFSYLRRQLGLIGSAADELVLESPFDYESQAMLYLPQRKLDPRDPKFASDAVPVIEEILDATRGRAFVLFTSNAVMRAVADRLAHRLPFPCRVQGDAPKNKLLEWFRAERSPVLFATASFWEGVDVVGEALSCVIVDRLPFPPPDDPIIAARSRILEEGGVDAFDALMVPAAIVRLKQGLGRLIRSTADRGLMCILDGRLETKSYGKRIEESLPPARRVHSLDEVREFLGGSGRSQTFERTPAP
jgi:ATP-dependent DNA helicase DinG